MKYFILITLFVYGVVALWPAPVNYTHGSSFVWISKDITFTYNNERISLNSDGKTKLSSVITFKAIVESAVQRAYTTIFDDQFVPWRFYPRNEISQYEPAASHPKIYIKRLTITQTGSDTTFKPVANEVDESYELSINQDGTSSITAKTSAGILLALQSFTQLFYLHSQPGVGVYSHAPVQISDSPKFSHRGMNLDVARNYYPVKDIKRTIEAISYNKLNRFHIHITDSQAWPLVIPSLPLLAHNGALLSSLVYTPEDLQDIQTYAIYHGVEVIIEIDTPGHTSSVALGYPEVIAAFDARPRSTYCAEPPCGTLKLNSSAVTEFMKTLLGDLLPRVNSFSAYFHTGGDEVKAAAYTMDETVNSSDTTIIGSYLQKFVDRNHDQVRANGLVPVVWEEMALDWGLTLGKDVVVQTWSSAANLAAVTALGHKALFGANSFWYLNCGKGAWINYENGAQFKKGYPFFDSCAPSHNWRLVYSYDPLAGIPENQTSLVLGGEVHLWSHQTDPTDLDATVWPRAAAAAEILWSGRQDGTGQNRSQMDAAPRLAEMRERLVARGIMASLVQEPFCTQHNATECT